MFTTMMKTSENFALFDKGRATDIALATYQRKATTQEITDDSLM